MAMRKKLLGSITQLCASFLILFLFGLPTTAQSVSYHLLKKVPLGAAARGGEYFDYVMADSDARRVYVSHGTEVKVVDADTGDIVGTITGLKKCHGIAVADGKGFITDGDEGKVFVFDTKTLKI